MSKNEPSLFHEDQFCETTGELERLCDCESCVKKMLATRESPEEEPEHKVEDTCDITGDLIDECECTECREQQEYEDEIELWI